MSNREDLIQLIEYLCDERRKVVPDNLGIRDDSELWSLFRSLVNTRKPIEASKQFYELQDKLLRSMIDAKGITYASNLSACELDNRISLWRGDITTIACDAIVNAANSQMLGCWVPEHFCIDNAIHTFAGVQLREECNRIMQAQGYEEPTGHAKVTSAFNLPSKYVIHTVGPIAKGKPTQLHSEQLASCYMSCLEAAEQCKCTDIAFCCISTGIFGFPQEQAASIAVETVRAWLDAHSDTSIHVVFNVFGKSDEIIYSSLLS